jgi:prevent-host-death family protein
MDLRKVFDSMISVSELGRGQASKVIQAVEDIGSPYIVVKNNKPQAVIISINEYTELMRAKEMLDAMRGTVDISALNSYTPSKMNALTEDEISIFLQTEEND